MRPKILSPVLKGEERGALTTVPEMSWQGTRGPVRVVGTGQVNLEGFSAWMKVFGM
jgi:hypothetical protein